MTTAIKITGLIIKGLRRNINPSSGKMLFALVLDKFKEKNKLLIEESQKTMEIFFLCLNLEDVIDEICEGLASKSNGMKIHTLSWIDKSIEKKQSSIANNKKEMNKFSQPFKILLPNIKKLIDENNSEVREAALSTLGRIKGVFGDHLIGTCIF